MNNYLSETDTLLHDKIHEQMFAQDPAVLLHNPRLEVLKIAKRYVSLEGVAADIGSGSGYFAIGLAKHYPLIRQVDAIEASKPAVEFVIPRNISFHQMESRVSPVFGSFDELSSEKYDLVFSMGSLHHSTNLRRTIQRIHQSLKPGGYIIAQEPAMPDRTTHEQYSAKYSIDEERFGMQIRNGDRYDRFFRECEYKSALVLAGFDLVLWRDFYRFNKYFRINAVPHLINRLFKIFNKFNFTSTLQPNVETLVSPASQTAQAAMAKATRSVKPKIFIAQKSSCKSIYHDP